MTTTATAPRPRPRFRPSDETNELNEGSQDHGAGRLLSSTSFVSSDGPPWPILTKSALHGVAGEVVNLLAPESEADPAALLATFLVSMGAYIGPTPHARAGHTTHPARLGAIIVGDTAKARKGTSWSTCRVLFQQLDLEFFDDRVLGGFGSGEAVVDEVADQGPDDEGVRDRRLIIFEAEFARILKVCARESSVLSTIIRDAWDGGRLQTRARSKKAIATGHHIAILGHITADELRRNLTETEIAGGFANRLLWVCAKRAQRLPFGGDIDHRALADVGHRLALAVTASRKLSRVDFSDDARDRWAALYDEMADDDPGGMLGAIVARPEPQTLRLALLYALLDGQRAIGIEHINAAWAFWRYSRTSARYIWGDTLGDAIADQLLRAIRQAGPAGLTKTEQTKAFSNNVPASRLDLARADLETRGLIVTETIPPEGGKGRPQVRSWAAEVRP